MGGIDKVGGGQRAFSQDELEAMRSESTSTIANKARRDAGFKDKDVTVRGDDRTLDQVLHDRKTHVDLVEVAGAALHGVEVAEAAGVGSHALHLLGRLPHIAVPLALFVAAQYSMVELERSKAEMKDGATRDQLHAAIVDRLDMPEGFKEAELKKLNVGMANQDAAHKISVQLDKHEATLQVHCDHGMHAARTMTEAGQTQEAFLKANPKIAERYANDAAFHNGFDALVWAKGDSPASYKSALDALVSRDARFDPTHVTYRM